MKIKIQRRPQNLQQVSSGRQPIGGPRSSVTMVYCAQGVAQAYGLRDRVIGVYTRIYLLASVYVTLRRARAVAFGVRRQSNTSVRAARIPRCVFISVRSERPTAIDIRLITHRLYRAFPKRDRIIVMEQPTLFTVRSHRLIFPRRSYCQSRSIDSRVPICRADRRNRESREVHGSLSE